MLKKHESLIVGFLTEMGISRNQARKIFHQCRGSQPVKIGTIRLSLEPNRFMVRDESDGQWSGIDLNNGQLI